MADVLKSAGHTQTYDWTRHGSVQSEGPKRLHEVAEAEKDGVLNAQIVIVILPGGRGTHSELGIAIAAGKKIIICSEKETFFLQDKRTCAFYWNSGIVRVVGKIDDWLCEIFYQAQRIDSLSCAVRVKTEGIWEDDLA